MDLILSTSLSNAEIGFFADGNAWAFKNISLTDRSFINCIDFFFKENSNYEITDIECIYVDIGPGGTSSVRTGVAVANAIAYGLRVPVVPVLSTEIIYDNARELHQGKKSVIIHRAIKGNVYISSKMSNDTRMEDKLLYGKLEDVFDMKIFKDADIIITDNKTKRDISSMLQDSNSVSFDVENYRVSIDHFIKIYRKFADRAIVYPKIAIPITENQVPNV